MKIAHCALILTIFLGGCSSRQPNPDFAIYRGVQFVSRDGMETYGEIVLIPRRLQDNVPLLLPDGTSMDVVDISAAALNKHGVPVIVKDDLGNGTYTLVNVDVYATFVAGSPNYISLDSPTHQPCIVSIIVKGQEVSVPIKRDDLEALLGPPDEILLGEYPGID